MVTKSNSFWLLIKVSRAAVLGHHTKAQISRIHPLSFLDLANRLKDAGMRMPLLVNETKHPCLTPRQSAVPLASASGSIKTDLGSWMQIFPSGWLVDFDLIEKIRSFVGGRVTRGVFLTNLSYARRKTSINNFCIMKEFRLLYRNLLFCFLKTALNKSYILSLFLAFNLI